MHLTNIMVRYDPPAYVLIDMGGTAGECIYPLALGFGAPGRGENLHRPPHEHASRPGDTASGLPRPPTIPRHGRHKLAQWVSMANVAQPPWPTSVFPGGSWQESALNPTQAGLWDRDGNINTATTAFPADQQGNDDGNFVPERLPAIGLRKLGAISGLWPMPGSTSAVI